MKQAFAEPGGRPFANDDFLTIQAEITAAVQAQFLGKGPFVLSGCQVTGAGPNYNVAAGIVCLDGQLLRFAGAGAVPLPAQFQAGAAVLSDPRPYQTGGTKNCMREVPALLVASDPTYAGGEFLPLDAWGSKRWDDVQRAQQWEEGDVKPSANLVAADYDSTGLGKPGTPAWGWGLCNGQGGRADLRGMFIVGHNPDRAGFSNTSIGDTGGEEEHTLTIAQLPSFKPVMPRVASPGGNNNGSVLLKGGDPGNGSLLRWEGEPIGGNQPHENRPPFYVLAMRQWVGYGI